MPLNYTYPSSYTLTRISQEFIDKATLEDPIFQLFPIEKINSAKMRWVVEDNYRGLMQIRGMGGEPTRVNKLGQKVIEEEPGVFGEFETLDETEMTNRAAWTLASSNGSDISAPVNVTDLTKYSMNQLQMRRIRRMKQACWNFALYHTLQLSLPAGGIGLNISYTGQTQTLSGGALFSAPTTSTPELVFRNLQQLYGIGTSGQFNGMATAWMNTFTKNYIMQNQNPADLFGRRLSNGSTVNNLAGFNQLLLDNDIPQIKIWDDGYYDDTNTFNLYIPTGYILVVAKRPNDETPGAFQMTRNANNVGAAPGDYAEIIDHTTGPARSVPPKIEVHAGFNGGPVVRRPSQMVTLIVA